MTPVGQTPYGKPLRVIELGYTQIPKEVFEDYLREIDPRYTQATYNVLRHNCNNFSEEVAQFLVGSNIPQYILGLPEEIMNSPMGPMLSKYSHTCDVRGNRAICWTLNGYLYWTAMFHHAYGD